MPRSLKHWQKDCLVSDEYNKDLCDEKHKNLTNDVKSIKNKMWWFVTIAIGSLVGMVLNFVKDMVVK